MRFWSLLLSVVVLSSGCALKTRTAPDAPLPFASVNYTVLGETTAESCGTYLLGIDFGHLFSNTAGSTTSSGAAAASPLGAILGALPIGGGGKEESRATYDALGKMPEATNLYAPRFESEASGILIFGKPIFGRRCATITAHGVQLGTGPVPNAN
jgi:hypothetical protein